MTRKIVGLRFCSVARVLNIQDARDVGISLVRALALADTGRPVSTISDKSGIGVDLFPNHPSVRVCGQAFCHCFCGLPGRLRHAQPSRLCNRVSKPS